MTHDPNQNEATQMSIVVVIPAYNAASFVRTAIDSVLAQTLRPDEVIVVDDGSTDDTRGIVSTYAPYVTLLTQANGGPARARNLAVASSHSRLIAFLDADDSWSPDKLERQVAALRDQPGSIFCYTGLMLMHPDGKQVPAPVCSPAEMGRVLRTRNPSISPSCAMVTREAFLQSGGFTERHRGSEDWELWFRLSQIGSFVCIRDPLTFYQVSTSGLSSDADHMMRDFEQMLEPLLLKDLHGTERAIWRRRILSEQCLRAALTARASGRDRTAVRYHLRSVALWPSPRLLPYRMYALFITLKGMLRGHASDAPAALPAKAP